MLNRVYTWYMTQMVINHVYSWYITGIFQLYDIYISAYTMYIPGICLVYTMHKCIISGLYQAYTSHIHAIYQVVGTEEEGRAPFLPIHQQ